MKMNDGLIRNSDGIILQVQVENKVWPGSAVLKIERFDGEEDNHPCTVMYLVDGSEVAFDDPIGLQLWESARS